jgi:hypothetical protein
MTRRPADRGAGPAPALPDAGQLERSVLYSEDLGIDLGRRRDADYFRWFLASILFGGRISESVAKNTYRAFLRHRLASPRRIIDAGRGFLVDPVMREGGYVRYDERKSDQVLRDCRMLLAQYRGRLSRLEAAAASTADLEARLDDFYGVGPVTLNIFLRELRPFWANADPEPLPVVRALARRLKLDLARYDRKSLTFARVEAGLIRLRRVLASSGGDKP